MYIRPTEGKVSFALTGRPAASAVAQSVSESLTVVTHASTKARHVGFVANKVALGQDYFGALGFPSAGVIPPMLHSHFEATPALHCHSQ